MRRRDVVISRPGEFRYAPRVVTTRGYRPHDEQIVRQLVARDGELRDLELLGRLYTEKRDDGTDSELFENGAVARMGDIVGLPVYLEHSYPRGQKIPKGGQLNKALYREHGPEDGGVPLGAVVRAYPNPEGAPGELWVRIKLDPSGLADEDVGKIRAKLRDSLLELSVGYGYSEDPSILERGIGHVYYGPVLRRPLGGDYARMVEASLTWKGDVPGCNVCMGCASADGEPPDAAAQTTGTTNETRGPPGCCEVGSRMSEGAATNANATATTGTTPVATGAGAGMAATGSGADAGAKGTGAATGAAAQSAGAGASGQGQGQGQAQGQAGQQQQQTQAGGQAQTQQTQAGGQASGQAGQAQGAAADKSAATATQQQQTQSMPAQFAQMERSFKEQLQSIQQSQEEMLRAIPKQQQTMALVQQLQDKISQSANASSPQLTQMQQQLGQMKEQMGQLLPAAQMAQIQQSLVQIQQQMLQHQGQEQQHQQQQAQSGGAAAGSVGAGQQQGQQQQGQKAEKSGSPAETSSGADQMTSMMSDFVKKMQTQISEAQQTFMARMETEYKQQQKTNALQPHAEVVGELLEKSKEDALTAMLKMDDNVATAIIRTAKEAHAQKQAAETAKAAAAQAAAAQAGQTQQPKTTAEIAKQNADKVRQATAAVGAAVNNKRAPLPTGDAAFTAAADGEPPAKSSKQSGTQRQEELPGARAAVEAQRGGPVPVVPQQTGGASLVDKLAQAAAQFPRSSMADPRGRLQMAILGCDGSRGALTTTAAAGV